MPSQQGPINQDPESHTHKLDPDIPSTTTLYSIVYPGLLDDTPPKHAAVNISNWRRVSRTVDWISAYDSRISEFYPARVISA
ncbi:hypothetical protein QCA50_019586 [Cerrena zonata]|uniref:Uncharacterized protein n=1 Tax=Cerrena zonata TaxID=2478898 RepID=A0AAW0FAF3_9APHY